MNGRVDDPEIGRFLSADPIIQDPYNTQSYNRYSYVWNNPLNMVDPSGYAGLTIDTSDPSNGAGVGFDFSGGNIVTDYGQTISGNQLYSGQGVSTDNLVNAAQGLAFNTSNINFSPSSFGAATSFDFSGVDFNYTYSQPASMFDGAIGFGKGLGIPVPQAFLPSNAGQERGFGFYNSPAGQLAVMMLPTPLGKMGGFPTKFHRRSVGEVAQLRKEFESIKPEFVRSYFNSAEAAKRFTPSQLLKMGKSGKLPKGYIIHHKNPLFRGGDNSFDNFRVMNSKFHQRYNKRLHWYEEGKNIYQ